MGNGCRTMNQDTSLRLTNYVAYRDAQTGRSRIGHYDLSNTMVHPLSFVSGTPIDNLYQVIEAGEANIITADDPISASSVKILPPLPDRDVLCVGKNYAEHAKEFNSSGFDGSDKVDTPSHPVIFTKRFTSIIADGEDIFPHPEFTQTLDYEGEVGVIVGKPAFRVAEDHAMEYVWGYTIINDVTARERQRDHKQFYIGKSADTFCPMGPIAVPVSKLDKVLRVQTHVNGELRQNATTDDLIFSIPYLIKTMSEGQTLMPGDVLATGTPAGVGIGRKPPIYLKPGDTVAVSVSGLGTLTNCIANPSSAVPVINRSKGVSLLRTDAIPRNANGVMLMQINNKPLHYKHFGKSKGPSVFFVHDVGASLEYFKPLITASNLVESHSLHLFDLEGHGLSPTSLLSRLSIESFAEDIAGIFQHAEISLGTTIVAHGMGCLVALRFAITHPAQVARLILMGPPPLPLPESRRETFRNLVRAARTKGMAAVADCYDGTSLPSREAVTHKPVVSAAIRMSLLGQDPEGYAKACSAVVEAESTDLGAVQADTLIITCTKDASSPPESCSEYVDAMPGKARLEVVEGFSHWHVFENLQEVTALVVEHLRVEEQGT
ncbi:fumarylacetoacetate hydrolase-like protein [Plenodomus tracheiphilus IPT5]|uniref:Fumarylacetoacetate hydrolase-like protein n=1 Tax=Plenodomus tracheiphilus IPT5 TaxID=1408161 RepID=A0A6A7AT00_9PLEO|nr:fumarylacetoacetate hydrolase-like protein [Plenodomus tracheiphilus IPT5]